MDKIDNTMYEMHYADSLFGLCGLFMECEMARLTSKIPKPLPRSQFASYTKSHADTIPTNRSFARLVCIGYFMMATTICVYACALAAIVGYLITKNPNYPIEVASWFILVLVFSYLVTYKASCDVFVDLCISFNERAVNARQEARSRAWRVIWRWNPVCGLLCLPNMLWRRLDDGNWSWAKGYPRIRRNLGA